jgi:serine/threonine protein phosphatase 1
MRPFLSSPKRRRPPQLPHGTRIYAVGDVHGRSDLLGHLLSEIDAHLAKNPIPRAIEIFLGDYIDRGADSRGVIDLLIERRRSREAIFLKGNHETYVSDFLRDPKSLEIWRQYGGFETLLSYGVKPSMRSSSDDRKDLARAFAAVLPHTHMEFLSGLITSFSIGDFFFAHAGVQPGVPIDQQREDDLLWIRGDFLLSEEDFEKYVVHGHTPVKAPDIRSNRANIDTGAFATGRLTCLMIEGEDLQVLVPSVDIVRETGSSPQISIVSASPPSAEHSAPAPPVLHPENSFVFSQSPAIVPTDERAPEMPVQSRSRSSFASPPDQAGDDLPPPPAPERDTQDGSFDTGRRSTSNTLKLTTSAIVALAFVGAMSVLTIRGFALRQNGPGHEEHPSLATAVPEFSPARGRENTAATPQLVLAPIAVRPGGDRVPLGARVSGDTAGVALEITNLPSGMTISSGRPLGAGGWRITAMDAFNATLQTPRGSSGAADLLVELRLADDAIVDRGMLHVEWLNATADLASAAAAAEKTTTNKVTSPSSQFDKSRAPPGDDSKPDAARIDFLIERSQRLMSQGDVEAARLLLKRAAEARDPRAALALGATYDPIMLRMLKVHGVTNDIALARHWYEKAKDFGSPEAQRRLELLAARMP